MPVIGTRNSSEHDGSNEPEVLAVQDCRVAGSVILVLTAEPTTQNVHLQGVGGCP